MIFSSSYTWACCVTVVIINIPLYVLACAVLILAVLVEQYHFMLYCASLNHYAFTCLAFKRLHDNFEMEGSEYRRTGIFLITVGMFLIVSQVAVTTNHHDQYLWSITSCTIIWKIYDAFFHARTLFGSFRMHDPEMLCCQSMSPLVYFSHVQQLGYGLADSKLY